MAGNNNMKDYDVFWQDIGNRKDWDAYILPKRTKKEFVDEGKKQAKILAKYIESNYVVLEFGCGVGRVIQQIDVPIENKIGVDVCQAFLDKIEQPITKVKTDGLTIDGIENESVDFVYSLMVFQHINKNDHVSLLKQLFGFLKSGQTMLIQFPKKDADGYYVQTEFVNIYTEEEIKQYAEEIGANLTIELGNLIGYGDKVDTKTYMPREFFALFKKK